MSENTKTTTAIDLELLDGRTFSFITRTYMCAADRVAFEKRFGVTSATLARMGSAMVEAGAGGKDPALADIPEGLDETWLMFFAWRCAVRAERDAFGQMPFDQEPEGDSPGGFIQQLAEYEQDSDAPKTQSPGEVDERVDPTDPGAPSA